MNNIDWEKYIEEEDNQVWPKTLCYLNIKTSARKTEGVGRLLENQECGITREKDFQDGRGQLGEMLLGFPGMWAKKSSHWIRWPGSLTENYLGGVSGSEIQLHRDMEFPSWLSRLRTWHRMQVQSLALLRELRISVAASKQWCRWQMWLRPSVAVAVVQASSCSSSETPSLGTSTCHRDSQKKKKKKEKEKSTQRQSKWGSRNSQHRQLNHERCKKEQKKKDVVLRKNPHCKGLENKGSLNTEDWTLEAQGYHYSIEEKLWMRAHAVKSIGLAIGIWKSSWVKYFQSYKYPALIKNPLKYLLPSPEAYLYLLPGWHKTHLTSIPHTFTPADAEILSFTFCLIMRKKRSFGCLMKTERGTITLVSSRDKALT